MPRHARTPLVAVAPSLLLGACAAPTISVGEATVVGRDAETVRLDVAVRLTNPATRPMPLLEWDYTVESPVGGAVGGGGGVAFEGTWSAMRTIPPGETVTVAIPAVVPAADFDPAAPILVRGSVSYRSPDRLARIFEEFGLYRPRQSFAGSAEPSAAVR
jgi:hypothetical protein